MLRGLERLLLPAMAVIGVVWLVAGSGIEPFPATVPKGRIAGEASGFILPSELPMVLDSAIVGLYDERDSLIYSGTPAEMEAYLQAKEDSLTKLPAPGRLLP